MGDAPKEWLQVAVGDVLIIVSSQHPMAVVRAPGAEELVVSWPDLNVGPRAITATVFGAPTGAWVFYQPVESEDPALPDGAHAAVHVARDGTVTRLSPLDPHGLLGATRDGLWLTSEVTAWHEDLTTAGKSVTVLGPDGAREHVEIDRRIGFVFDDGDTAHVVFYDGAPRKVPRPGGTSLAPRFAIAALPRDAVRRGDLTGLAAERIEDAELTEIVKALVPSAPDVPPLASPLPWELTDLSLEHKHAAVASALREFHPLTRPSHGIADAMVRAVGDWPHTRVEVTFTHPHFASGRLRRTLRVFDDAGRIVPTAYASVHLKEDLGTGNLPDPANARDGVLDI